MVVNLEFSVCPYCIQIKLLFDNMTELINESTSFSSSGDGHVQRSGNGVCEVVPSAGVYQVQTVGRSAESCGNTEEGSIRGDCIQAEA